MTWTLLLPAAGIVTALVALTVGLRRVERDLIPLRASLRRTSATAVAVTELRRATAGVAGRAAEVEADARRRVRRPRAGRRPEPR